MQKGSRDLLKILKNYRDLQRSTLKAGRNNLNDFRNDLKSLGNLFESFKDASEGEVKPRDFNGDLNENQLEAEWTQWGSKETQQRLSQYIIYNYVWEENPYFKPFSFFKFIVHLLQDFDLWAKKMQGKAKAETHLKEYQFNAESFLQYQKILYLFKDYVLLTEVMKRYHDNLYAEHFKYEKTFKIIQRKIF